MAFFHPTKILIQVDCYPDAIHSHEFLMVDHTVHYLLFSFKKKRVFSHLGPKVHISIVRQLHILSLLQSRWHGAYIYIYLYLIYIHMFF